MGSTCVLSSLHCCASRQLAESPTRICLKRHRETELRFASRWRVNCQWIYGGPSHMQTGASARIGDRVSFRIADVFFPEPSEVLANLTAYVETNGVGLEFSHSR